MIQMVLYHKKTNSTLSWKLAATLGSYFYLAHSQMAFLFGSSLVNLLKPKLSHSQKQCEFGWSSSCSGFSYMGLFFIQGSGCLATTRTFDLPGNPFVKPYLSLKKKKEEQSVLVGLQSLFSPLWVKHNLTGLKCGNVCC